MILLIMSHDHISSGSHREVADPLTHSSVVSLTILEEQTPPSAGTTCMPRRFLASGGLRGSSAEPWRGIKAAPGVESSRTV